MLRVRDENNYYATRLTLQQPAPHLELAEEHFSVLGGVEGTHSRKVISLGSTSGSAADSDGRHWFCIFTLSRAWP